MPDKDKLNNVIDAYAASAYGTDTDGGELSRQRALALDAFAGKNIEPAPEGRSQVVDRTTFETVQWILPSIMRIFAGGDRVVEFEPMGPDDEDAAEQESEYLNYLVTQKNNWYKTMMEWAQDALITKNAYCLAFMEEKLQPEKTEYEGMTEEQLALLLEDDSLEVVQGNSYPDPDYEPQPLVDEAGQPVLDEMGQPVIQPPPMKYDVTVKQVRAKKKLQFQVLPPERCLVDEATPDFTLEECNYFEYWEKCPISDLRKMGFDVPDDIGSESSGEYFDTEEDSARDDILGGEFDSRDDGEIPDPSMRRVRVRNIWVRHDYDEDGIAELQHVIRVGNEILERKECSRIPVASIVPFLNTHRHMGMSVVDLVFDVQRIKTALLRGGLDSLYLGNNPRHAISDKVHLDDLLVARPGAPVRLKNGAIPGEGHIMPLQTENIFPYAREGLLHMDTVVEARVGVNRIFQGIDESSVNDHNRIGQLSSMAAQRVEQIARIFANGVERLFSIAHELIIKEGHQSESVKLRGQWVDIDPSQWKTGRDMRVVAPFAAGNKDALLQRLMFIAQIHEKALAGGLPIVQADDAYNLALEIAKASDVSGDKFFTDPATIPPPEPQPDYTMLALEVENRKIDQAETESERETEADQFEAVLRGEIEKYKIDTNAELQLALAQMKAGESVNLEQIRANLKNEPPEVSKVKDTVQQTTEVVERLQQALSDANNTIGQLQSKIDAPREVVRDQDGKVTGVRINGEFRELKRDKSGKVVGL